MNQYLSNRGSLDGQSNKDRLQDTCHFLDVDLFMVSSLILENAETMVMLDCPSKLKIEELKEKTDALLKELNIPRFQFSEESSNHLSDENLLDHISIIKQAKKHENQTKIQSFIHQHFYPPGSDLVLCENEELKCPSTLERFVTNSELLIVVRALHQRWSILYKKNIEVGNTSTRIFLDYPFVVPGGRFQEFYYWDTWFVLEGLVAAELKEIAENMVRNCADLIFRYGFIPNGTRHYYRNRSQPPFFCSMLESLQKFNDADLNCLVLTQGLHAAIKELEYFEKNKMVKFEFNGRSEKLFRYFVDSDYPRLESFLNDLETMEEAIKFEGRRTNELQRKIFSSLKAAAESGIDFSTRWFGDKKNLHTIETIHHIPVDLNSLIYKNLRTIAKLCKMNNDEVQAQKYEKKANDLAQAICRVLWNHEAKCWNDFNFVTKQYNDCYFFPSNLFPLLFGIPQPEGSPHEIISLYQQEIFGEVGGIPASGRKAQSGQQWDYPNVWAPYIYLFFQYFDEKLKQKDMAFHIAKTFFNSVLQNFKKTEIFFEKYKATTNQEFGGGGEYKVQDGFGWTNGVTICFLRKYKDKLAEDFNHKHSFAQISNKLQVLVKQHYDETTE